MSVKYRALIGVPAYTPEDGHKPSKQEREEYQWNIMKTALLHWDSSVPVAPYPDEWSSDPDKYYINLIKKTKAIKIAQKNSINIDNPVAVLNYFGNPMGQVYFTEKPKAWREKDERKPANNTGVYVYSVLNPDGMFSKYCYPIESCYNGIDVESNKLVNKNYGTTHDMLEVGDVDWEATYVPTVAFVTYFEETEPASTQKRHPVMETVEELFESKDPLEIEKFYLERLGKHGMVAIIECETGF